MSTNCETGSTSAPSGFTAQQLKQLMKLLPSPSKVNGSETDEEMDSSYAGMVSCFQANVKEGVWIIDSGASHHMTGDLNLLCEVKETGNPPLISLPTGE